MKTNNQRTQLENMLNTYNLMDTVVFPTRITNNSTTLIDNIFIDNRRSYVIKPCINGLSDHDAQLIILNNISVPNKTPKSTYTRNINNTTIMEFQYLLSLESWENIFSNNNVNIIFNNFHNTYLRCFHACFSKKRTRHNINHNKWIITGIRKSCNRKRELFLLSRDNNDINLKILL
jgi:hypothetical protein